LTQEQKQTVMPSILQEARLTDRPHLPSQPHRYPHHRHLWVIRGADSWIDIEMYGKSNIDRLNTIMELASTRTKRLVLYLLHLTQ
jgi:hypothetical protein